MSVEALKKLLVRKMGASSVFSGVLDNIDNHPEWSWSKVQEVIRDKHMRITSSDVVNNSAKISERDSQSVNDSSTAIMNVQNSNPNPKFIARKQSSKTCWNCKCEGHSTSACPSLFCRNCGQFWTSDADKGFHFPTVCEKRPVNSSNKRKNDKDQGPQKKKLNSVTFANAISTNVSVWDQMCSDEAVVVDNDEEDNVEEILNSVHSIYLSSILTNYLIFGVASQGSEVYSSDFNMLMLDSGAAISITHPQVAKLCGVPILRLSQSTVVYFANNTTAEVSFMANFGPVLGKVLLCSEVSSTLISVVQLSTLY